MSFSPPTVLRDIVLYWWRIVDAPQILKDDLLKFIAFDLYLTSFPKAQKMVTQAIKLGFLIEDSSMEYVQLNSELRAEFTEWQEKGREKAQKMEGIIRTSWRQGIEISENQHYLALIADLIDPSIFTQSQRIRSSAIKLNHQTFTESISGQAKDYDEKEQSILYPFEIDVKGKKITHNCPDYLNFRQTQKMFCPHLARLIIKLYANEPTQTVQLLKQIVHQKPEWTFEES